MPIDPFSLKSLPKAHPRRLGYVAWARYQDWVARRRYQQYAVPVKPPDGGPPPATPTKDTAVTALQYHALWAALRATEHLTDTRVVEVGAYRGVTTAFLATHTPRPVVAVDPFAGCGAGDGDFAAFRANTSSLGNVTHERRTSGAAAAGWPFGRSIGLCFIDAQHDYANTRFDILTWLPHVVSCGIMALHDVDEPGFAGTRRAVGELLRGAELFAHVDNLAAFRIG